MFKPDKKFVTQIENFKREVVVQKEFNTEKEADAFGEQYLYLENRNVSEPFIVSVFERTITLVSSEVLHPIA